MNPKKAPLTFGLVAAGRIGVMHGKNLLTHDLGVRLKTVYDKYKRTAWLKEAGLAVEKVTDCLAEVMEDKEIDAVVIAASTTAHLELVEKAAAAGKHIFCEKPVALEARLIHEVTKKVAAAGVIFQVAYNRRFDPDYQRLKTWYQDGAVGRLHRIHIINRDPLRPPYHFIPKSGGLFIDFNSHDFDLIHFLTGEEIEEVFAFGGNLVDKKIGELGDLDTAVISLRLKGGALCSIDCSRETHYGYDQQIELFGAQGSLKVQNFREHNLMLSRSTGVEIAKPKANFMVRYEESYLAQLRSFIKSVREGTAAAVGGEEARRAILVAEAVKKAQQEKRVVKVVYDN